MGLRQPVVYRVTCVSLLTCKQMWQRRGRQERKEALYSTKESLYIGLFCGNRQERKKRQETRHKRQEKRQTRETRETRQTRETRETRGLVDKIHHGQRRSDFKIITTAQISNKFSRKSP